MGNWENYSFWLQVWRQNDGVSLGDKEEIEFRKEYNFVIRSASTGFRTKHIHFNMCLAFIFFGILSFLPIVFSLLFIGSSCLDYCPAIKFHPIDIAVIGSMIIIAMAPLIIINLMLLRARLYDLFKLSMVWLCCASLLSVVAIGLTIDPDIDDLAGTISGIIMLTWPLTLLILSIYTERVHSKWICLSINNSHYIRNRARHFKGIMPKQASKWSIAFCIIFTLPIFTIAYAFTADWPEEPYHGPAPIFQVDCTEDSNGDYQCNAIKTSKNIALESFQYFLKDATGLTRQFGEIALQNISGQWHGIEVTWDDTGGSDTKPGNGRSDRADSAGGPYNDPRQAQIRIDSIRSGSQDHDNIQKSEGLISVSFSDNDRNGKLTAGDRFSVQGNRPEHPANDEWRLEIKYDITDDTIGSFRLGV